MNRTASRTLALAVTPLLLTGIAACGSDSGSDGASGDTVAVAAGFYPLAFVAERVGGDRVAVSSLTEPGVEPHDLELSPRQVAQVVDSDLVLHLGGFQPAVDDAVADAGGSARAFDVAGAARLIETTHAEEHAAEEEAHGDETHEDEAHSDADEHAHEDGGVDPHFWLDPQRLGYVAAEVAEQLAEIDPDGADGFRERAESLQAELTVLEEEFRTGLADCTGRTLVTSHAAFGYLALNHDLELRAISGLSPDAEPSPGTVAEITELVRERDVRTVYSETLVSPEIAETIARETGARTAVLDPLEGLTDESAGDDYFAVMRSNLATLREGQPCT
jgi:zinc transport system substrate-binding protein